MSAGAAPAPDADEPSSPAGAGGDGVPATAPGSRRVSSRSRREALAELILVVAAGVVAAVVTHTVAILAVVLAIVAMVMLHELGHFVTAKAAGMKVTEYFLGFGPRLWSMQRGETEYGVKAIPAGGYVRIVGMSSLEEVDPADEPRAYRQKPFWRRVSVAMAGSVVHFMLAILLLWWAYLLLGVPSGQQVGIGGLVKIDGVANPAQQAGLRPGDVIVSVNGHRVTTADGVSSAIKPHAGQSIPVVVERDGKRLTFYVTPVDSRTHHEQGVNATPGSGSEGVIGVDLGVSTAFASASPLRTFASAAAAIGGIGWQTLVGVGHFFSPSGISSYAHQLSAPAGSQASPNADRVESVVGIVRLASQAAHTGLATVLELLAAINIFIGIFNMVPLLPLDGGHVAIAVYERLRSRKGRRYRVDATKLLPATYLVVVFIMVLGVTAVYLDIAHPLANPFR
jgi:membrane-associated protease RseP (regulator of RpoE activity)